MNTRKSLTIGVLALTLILSAYVLTAFAVGTLRIDPPLPYMNESPSEFTVWVEGQATAAYNPIILLVMTESSYNGLSADPEVEWAGGSVTLSTWNMETSNGVKVPPSAQPGYTVASLKDHLDTSKPIYWAIGAILDGPIVPGETYELTVYLESSAPKMLVYVLGESEEGSGKYNVFVPPTIPGFVIPEVPLGTVLTLVTMMGAVGVYKLRNRVRLS